MKCARTLDARMMALFILLAAVTLPAACSEGLDEAEFDVGTAEQALSVPLTGKIFITSQWTTGYCANVTVSNGSASNIASWTTLIDLNGSTLTSLWDAQGSVTAGRLTATAQSYNAALPAGSSTSFGLCASRTSSRILPKLISVVGEDTSEPPADLSASLTLTSDWDTGYCASVRLRNSTDQTANTWEVVIDLNASLLSSIWEASGSTSGGNLTALPLSHNAVIPAGGETAFGFCANKTGSDYRPVVVFPGGSTVNQMSVAVYIPRRISTCFIGDPCPASRDDCVGLRNDDNLLVESFIDASFEAVRTTDPRRDSAAKEVCVEMVLSEQDRQEILGELDGFQSNVGVWSHGDIELELRIIEFDHLDMDLGRFGGGVWIAPWNLVEFAVPELDFVPDFNMVVPPIRDPELQLHHDLGGCGGAFGADLGIAGAGWSWIPKTKSSFFFDCAEQPVLTHEWLHQVHFAYHEVSNFDDLYGDDFPACGAGDPDGHRWFPDSHQCDRDPDYALCGFPDCGSNDMVNEHILGVHWDPAFDFIANHCQNGIQDFGETGTDTGGPCLMGVGSARPATPDFVTPTP